MNQYLNLLTYQDIFNNIASMAENYLEMIEEWLTKDRAWPTETILAEWECIEGKD